MSLVTPDEDAELVIVMRQRARCSSTRGGSPAALAEKRRGGKPVVLRRVTAEVKDPRAPG